MQKQYYRREFLRNAAIMSAGIVGSLVIPEISFGKMENSYKTNDFSRDSEKVLLARLIYGEARSTFKHEKDQREPIMIGFTPINRVNDTIRWNGMNLKEVILKNGPVKTKTGEIIIVYQYSCFDPEDKNLKKIKDPEKYDSKSWEQSLGISGKLLEGKYTHLNYGQDHYHKKDMTEYPEWTKSPRMKKIWGQEFFKHYFYKDIMA